MTTPTATPRPPGRASTATGGYPRGINWPDPRALSDPPGTVHSVTVRISSDLGVTQVVKLRLNPSGAQVELLRGYCGTARAAYNTLLFQVKANLGQRAAEKTYGVADQDLTPALSWHKFGLEKLLRANRDCWLPWHAQVPYLVLDRQAHQLAAGLAKWKTGSSQFPRFRKKRGVDAGLVPVTFKEKDSVWLTDGGRALALPISMVTRREFGSAASAQLASVPVVKDNRGRRAAKLIAGGRGQVQEVTFSFSGGYWWASLRMRVLPAAKTQPTRHLVRSRAAAVGVDAGMGRHFATLDKPLPGVTDVAGHIDAPLFLRRALKDLAVAQRAFKRTIPGSRRHAKALARVQKLHGRVAARRETWQQHLAIALTEHAQAVGVETLNLRGMARKTKGFRFSRSVGDNGFGLFVELLTRQAAKRGSAVVKADRFYPSSKTCSDCAAVKTKLPLSEREYTCTACGLRLDRDVNAARNLAALARTELARTAGSGIPPGSAGRDLVLAA
jgi:putative transposase